MATGVEELVDMLFAMIDEAKSVPLSSEKCIIERDKALDLLDEIRGQFPMELSEAKKLIASRNDYIASAKREAALMKKQAEEQARALLKEAEEKAARNAQTVTAQTRESCEALRGKAEGRLAEAAQSIVRRVVNS